ncbi:MAG: AAA family ATPase [Mariprofundaceae bacterium]
MTREEEMEKLFSTKPDTDLEKCLAERWREVSLKKGEVMNGQVKIFNDLKHLRAAAKEFRKENEDLARKLRHEVTRGCMASVDKVQSNYKTVLNDMLLRFPNFEQVILKIRAELSLAQLTEDKVLQFETPLLLLGPPGVGKTFFLNELAEQLSVASERVSCSDSNAGFILSGLTSGFSTGQPGLVYNSVVSKRIANPIIIIDEVDKASKASGNGPPIESVFYSLLEPMSARSYKDECMKVEFDASYISWLATANELNEISGPIRDRFEVVEIPYPSDLERKSICMTLYEKILKTHGWGIHFSEALEDGVISMLSTPQISIRQLKKMLFSAMAIAAEEKGDHFEKAAEKIILQPSHFRMNKRTVMSSKIGFIH